ncbi:MAG: hypothetical protein OXD32_06710, partial [Endozoicomonadaceae bacterium]|nr:hypothetical protein [Endozoicomonadaceae bacterium]
MKLTTGNVIFYLILFLLLHPLPSTAMYRNTVKPIKITYHETQPAEETSSSEENCNESTNTVQDLTLQDKIAINSASKQKYLMDIIKRCNWTGFEWVELRHYLLHYMFDLKQLHRVFDLKYNSCDPDNPDDVSSHLFIDSRKHEVEFLEITAETDGTQII